VQRSQGPARLTVVQRRDCELCEHLLSQLTALARSLTLPPIDVVDVDADAELVRRYGLHVPVLLLDGEVVCRHRLDVPELKRLLRL
jgi:predicted thioredoxin/glutaredoxin